MHISTSELADKVAVVAKAMPVKRSVKAIPNNSPWFLVIVAKIRWICTDLYLANFI